MSDTVEVTRLPHCQIHESLDQKIPASYDAKTVWGPWSYMCDQCYANYGPGRLGTGFGQKLVLKIDLTNPGREG